MDIFIAQPHTIEQAAALKAVMEALKIEYEIKTAENSSYNKAFVAKILESKQQAKEGKTVQIDLESPVFTKT